MKKLSGLLIAMCLLAGCATGSMIPHDDSVAATDRDLGPALCRDGSVPPCNSRD
jgi:hypothetical protein